MIIIHKENGKILPCFFGKNHQLRRSLISGPRGYRSWKKLRDSFILPDEGEE